MQRFMQAQCVIRKEQPASCLRRQVLAGGQSAPAARSLRSINNVEPTSILLPPAFTMMPSALLHLVSPRLALDSRLLPSCLTQKFNMAAVQASLDDQPFIGVSTIRSKTSPCQGSPELRTGRQIL
ncbi:uncharacterized protein TRUGW13939_08348 [Talaromyces rugulosus]|uniref:Uncharacterized protein n=1 Tax=Talaromyces rugulosus TaxID=121627 RepID=A0A7H8R657_TALRU|nr:uncharacterized protein TRUGW13939_08348 [Talaromyces rugulosus]QKX61201.1 hypothetical protein TRUGW13939_08348 [Talaromyces rugulosus]